MERPKCPVCGFGPTMAFARPNFTCPNCGTRLSSNLRFIGFVEWALGSAGVVAVVLALHAIPFFKDWSYIKLLGLLFLPACGIHVLVIAKFVRLEIDQ